MNGSTTDRSTSLGQVYSWRRIESGGNARTLPARTAVTKHRSFENFIIHFILRPLGFLHPSYLLLEPVVMDFVKVLPGTSFHNLLLARLLKLLGQILIVDKVHTPLVFLFEPMRLQSPDDKPDLVDPELPVVQLVDQSSEELVRLNPFVVRRLDRFISEAA